MAYPVILFNASGGSDTAASGAGPGTALTNTDAATDGAGLIVTVPNADLSGVAVDGSHVIWVKTASGQQYGKITNKAASGTAGANVTVASAFGTGLTGKTYGIGGKRATYEHADSRTLFVDAKAGWTIRTEQAGGAQVLTTNLLISAPGSTALPIIWEGDSPTSRATVTTATSSVKLVQFVGGAGQGYWTVRNHLFSNTAAARDTGFYPNLGEVEHVLFDNCIFDGFTLAIDDSYTTYWSFQQLLLKSCEIKNCTLDGLRTNYAAALIGCYLHDNTLSGCAIYGASAFNAFALTVRNCVFQANGADGLNLANADFRHGVIVTDCAFVDNAGDGIDGSAITTAGLTLALINNICWSNGGYGVNLGIAPSAVVNQCNAYGDNTSGARNNLAVGTGDVTLTGNPWVDSSTGDFDLDSTTGEGAACRSAGWPGLFDTNGLSSTRGYADIGVSRHPDPAAGSGISRSRAVNAGS